MLNWRKNSGRVKKKYQDLGCCSSVSVHERIWGNGPSILGFWEIFKWIITEWENAGSVCALRSQYSRFLRNYQVNHHRMGKCRFWGLWWELWAAPWEISPGVTEPHWNESHSEIACQLLGEGLLWVRLSQGKRRHLLPSCGSRLTWGMMGITGLHKGRESPCQQFPLHSQVETVNTHLPYCLFSLLLLFLHFFVWFF